MEVIQLLTDTYYVTGVIINEKWFHRRPQNGGRGRYLDLIPHLVRKTQNKTTPNPCINYLSK